MARSSAELKQRIKRKVLCQLKHQSFTKCRPGKLDELVMYKKYSDIREADVDIVARNVNGGKDFEGVLMVSGMPHQGNYTDILLNSPPAATEEEALEELLYLLEEEVATLEAKERHDRKMGKCGWSRY